MNTTGKLLGLTGLAWLLGACGPQTSQQQLFEEVTYRSGIDYQGMTHGAAWGDVDGDGYPDIYLTNHLNRARLYRNLGNGRFEDVSERYFSSGDLEGDKHGVAWADFDNDGDQDLVQLTGAQVGVGHEPKRLFRNEGTRLVDVAAALGVDNPDGRTRSPLWFDGNQDGKLDLFQGAEARFDNKTPPFWFIQDDNRFRPASEWVTEQDRSMPYCLLGEFDGQGPSELLCRVFAPRHAYRVFDTGEHPFAPHDVLPNTAFWDAAVGDFDNDGDFDLYMARRTPANEIAVAQPAATRLHVDLRPGKQQAGKPLGFSFRATGPVTFRVSKDHSYKPFTLSQIDIGPMAVHPDDWMFRLEPGSVGALPDEVGEDTSRLQVGFTAPDLWSVRLISRPAPEARHRMDSLALAIETVSPVQALTFEGVKPTDTGAPDRLFINEGGRLVEQGQDRGIGELRMPSVSVVTADFDNDMDLDLYVVTGDELGNPENLLLLNEGDGRFVPAEGAGGAPGSGIGVGEVVAVADYDRDGFMDLLLANGNSMGRSLGPAAYEGGYQLYHNRGNGNHWLEVDLEGSLSNRDGIGARVALTTGGITQVRLQDGGQHHRAQNDRLIHFGLGRHETIERLVVYWPSGQVQELRGIAADQVLKVRESGVAKDNNASGR